MVGQQQTIGCCCIGSSCEMTSNTDMTSGNDMNSDTDHNTDMFTSLGYTLRPVQARSGCCDEQHVTTFTGGLESDGLHEVVTVGLPSTATKTAGLYKGCYKKHVHLVFSSDLVKLIHTADPPVSQHQGPSLQGKGPTEGVPHHCGCQACTAGRRATHIKPSRGCSRCSLYAYTVPSHSACLILSCSYIVDWLLWSLLCDRSQFLTTSGILLTVFNIVKVMLYLFHIEQRVDSCEAGSRMQHRDKHGMYFKGRTWVTKCRSGKVHHPASTCAQKTAEGLSLGQTHTFSSWLLPMPGSPTIRQ